MTLGVYGIVKRHTRQSRNKLVTAKEYRVDGVFGRFEDRVRTGELVSMGNGPGV
jgi:hypothetical protein